MKVEAAMNEGEYMLSNGSVLIARSEYKRMIRNDELIKEAVSMIAKSRSPEDVVAYIKLQTAAWVVDRL